MHQSTTPRRAPLAGAFAALGLVACLPAQAALCTLTDTGTPILTTVNPKPFTVPPPSTCLVNGLPGVGSDLPGYILVASRTAPVTVGSATVGTLYDRVYCTGTGSTCDATKTYILATRVQMLAGPASHPACPLWSGTTTECFEINDIFRATRSAVGAEVGYWMGSSNSGVADTQLAVKYLEYTGRTFIGLNQGTVTRNNAKVAFRTDVNIFDPDGVNAPWSPWLLVKQNCANGVVTTNLTTTALTKFAIRFRQGGEEGQIQTYVEAAAYACNS